MAANDGVGTGMASRLWQYWRVLGTGFCFSVFGLGGLALRLFVFPLLNLFVRVNEQRIRWARQVVRYSFIAFIWLMRAFGIFRFTSSGLERLNRKGMLIVANHPTLIDTIFLMALVEHADCVVKNDLWRNPFTRGPIRAAGYISNASSEGLIEDCIASLLDGGNLIIFPEGTRTPASGSISLKRGVANVAVRGRRNLTPVIIRCEPRILGKNTKWWRVPIGCVNFHIEVHEDIDVLPFITESSNEVLAVRRLTNFLQNYFNKENTRHGFA